MYVSVRGAKDRKLVTWLRVAANFYADELMHKNLVKNIDLKIVIKSSSKDFTDKGQCEWDDIDGPPNPRSFTIMLARPVGDSVKELFSTLAHEMVHLKQFARKELWDYETGRVQWKSRTYGRLHHDDQPWEREAYRLEGELYEEFEEWYYE